MEFRDLGGGGGGVRVWSFGFGVSSFGLQVHTHFMDSFLAQVEQELLNASVVVAQRSGEGNLKTGHVGLWADGFLGVHDKGVLVSGCGSPSLLCWSTLTPRWARSYCPQ